MRDFLFRNKLLLAHFCLGVLFGGMSVPIVAEHLRHEDIFSSLTKDWLNNTQTIPGEIVSLKLCIPSEIKKIPGLTRAKILLKSKLPSGINYISESATVPPTKVTSNIDGKTILEWNLGTQDLKKDFYEIEFSGIVRPDATTASISIVEFFVHLIEQKYLRHYQIDSTRFVVRNKSQNCRA